MGGVWSEEDRLNSKLVTELGDGQTDMAGDTIYEEQHRGGDIMILDEPAKVQYNVQEYLLFHPAILSI